MATWVLCRLRCACERAPAGRGAQEMGRVLRGALPGSACLHTSAYICPPRGHMPATPSMHPPHRQGRVGATISPLLTRPPPSACISVDLVWLACSSGRGVRFIPWAQPRETPYRCAQTPANRWASRGSHLAAAQAWSARARAPPPCVLTTFCPLILRSYRSVHGSQHCACPPAPRRRSRQHARCFRRRSAARSTPTACVLAALAPLTVPAGRPRGHLHGACTVAVATTHHCILANTFTGDSRTPWRPQIRA